MVVIWRQDWFWGVIAFSLLGIFLFFVNHSLSQEKALCLSAVFDHVNNLQVGSPVKLSGLTVGRVKKITIQSDDLRIKVIIAFDNNFEIPEDSDIRISTTGLLSEPQLDLKLGGSLKLLSNDDEFFFTQSSIDFLRLFRRIIESAAEKHSIQE